MTTEAIQSRAKAEAAVYAVAVEIRQLLDKAAREIELPDVDVEERILELVSGDE